MLPFHKPKDCREALAAFEAFRGPPERGPPQKKHVRGGHTSGKKTRHFCYSSIFKISFSQKVNATYQSLTGCKVT